MDSQELQPGSASYSSCEEYLVQDLAQAFILKSEDRDSFNNARHSGMVELPSELAIKAGLMIFGGDRTAVRHKSFVQNPTLYESTHGKVTCDAGNRIYARVFQDREATISQLIPWVSHFSTPDPGSLVAVVLHQYRNQTISHRMEALVHLESEVERVLIEALKAETINLFVTLMNGKTLELQAYANGRVSRLKTQISILTSIPSFQQVLVFHEDRLHSSSTLTEIGIGDGAMLHLVVCE